MIRRTLAVCLVPLFLFRPRHDAPIEALAPQMTSIQPGGGFIARTIVFGLLWWLLAIAPVAVMVPVGWFCSNPHREIPQLPGQALAPIVGDVVLIEEIEDPKVVREVSIGLFLSTFKVHANRSPIQGRVTGLR